MVLLLYKNSHGARDDDGIVRWRQERLDDVAALLDGLRFAVDRLGHVDALGSAEVFQAACNRAAGRMVEGRVQAGCDGAVAQSNAVAQFFNCAQVTIPFSAKLPDDRLVVLTVSLSGFAIGLTPISNLQGSQCIH